LLPTTLALAADGQGEWKLRPTTMNQGDCGMVKTVKGIVEGETLSLIGNIKF
jgi:hypothetical protein